MRRASTPEDAAGLLLSVTCSGNLRWPMEVFLFLDMYYTVVPTTKQSSADKIYIFMLFWAMVQGFQQWKPRHACQPIVQH